MKAAPWALVVLMIGVLALQRGCDSRVTSIAVERAEAAEDSLAVLGPLVEDALAQARQRDTVLVQVTDTVTVTVERLRIEYREVDSQLRPTLDSIQVVYLDQLEANHAEQMAAKDRQIDALTLWGQSWKDAAEVLEVQAVQLTLRGDAWEQAYKSSQSQNRWLKLGGTALVGLAGYQAVTGN